MARNRDRFARATGMSKGYRREQVDAWLSRVETAMRLADGMPTVSSAEVRKVGFDLVRRGYDVAAVDAHLDRLEELAVAAEATADAALGALAGGGSEADAGRLARDLDVPDGERFARAPLLARGYDPRDVDAFVEDVLLPGLTGAAPLPAVDQVRAVVFRARRGGYDEGAVDDALDAVVDHLLRRERLAQAVPVPAAGGCGEPLAPPQEPAAEPAPADPWAVDNWWPEPHRVQPAPVAGQAPVAEPTAADEQVSWPEGWAASGPVTQDGSTAAEDQPTVVWPAGLPAQGPAAARPADAWPEAGHGEDQAVPAGPATEGADPGQDEPRPLGPRLPRRTGTGTGWPG